MLCFLQDPKPQHKEHNPVKCAQASWINNKFNSVWEYTARPFKTSHPEVMALTQMKILTTQTVVLVAVSKMQQVRQLIKMVLHRCSSHSALEVKMQMPEPSNFRLPLILKWSASNSLKRKMASAEMHQLVDKALLNKPLPTISRLVAQIQLVLIKMKLRLSPLLRSNSAKAKFSNAQMSHPKKINNSMLTHSRSTSNLKKLKARSRVKLRLKQRPSY